MKLPVLISLLALPTMGFAQTPNTRAVFFNGELLDFQASQQAIQGPIVGEPTKADCYVCRWTDKDGATHEVVTVRTGTASLPQHLQSVRVYQQSFPPVLHKDKPGP